MKQRSSSGRDSLQINESKLEAVCPLMPLKEADKITQVLADLSSSEQAATDCLRTPKDKQIMTDDLLAAQDDSNKRRVALARYCR